MTKDVHVLYQATLNDHTLLTVRSELPAWAPTPTLDVSWLRLVLAGAVRSSFREIGCTVAAQAPFTRAVAA